MILIVMDVTQHLLSTFPQQHFPDAYTTYGNYHFYLLISLMPSINQYVTIIISTH